MSISGRNSIEALLLLLVVVMIVGGTADERADEILAARAVADSRAAESVGVGVLAAQDPAAVKIPSGGVHPPDAVAMVVADATTASTTALDLAAAAAAANVAAVVISSDSGDGNPP